VLCDVLIEHLIVKFQRILLGQFIVELTTMGLNDIAVFRPSIVNQTIVVTFNVSVLDCLFVGEGSVFVINKSLCG
jgi:hypothetical protein